MESLKGKKALITGAGKGIGRAIAIALAAEGVDIALMGRSAGPLEEVAAAVRQQGVKAAVATGDVAKIDEVNAAVASLTAELGQIDILVNNAGISSFGGFMDLTPERWEEIIQVNLLGAYYVTRAVLPSMIDRKTGDIINISSTAGQKGAPATSAYSASKFGLLGMTESLMLEVRKHNIRVSALTPSTIATDMAKELNLTDGNPEKVMQPEDLAEVVVAQLKLNRRVLLKSATLFSTNP
ncbi:3-oxoacyl-[acyl-carrier protein] reductase [Chitinophaga jiangningensis]|uniref:3-oxoacyl-[acyl-carrier protein] reductase n=1 Tax=Chitinophaga jiangningensis TaxID=1419482 RepID=A0A1M7BRF3_9BACT|nr:3-ketoacyl-ACP reductase [Chitinophaga jiangningensis]SHL57540.1 3-oxoacyl-[acyl-carrier protein] reductase [Chitinophaga jiangningensis]